MGVWRRMIAAAFLAVCIGASPALAGTSPNDPLYFHQWYAQKLGWEHAASRIMGLELPVIAVLDSGVSQLTPDLAGRVLPPISTSGFGPFDEDQLRGSVLAHGTWVAGSIAMMPDNGIGGAGVAPFTILPITVTDAAMSNPSGAAIDQGIRAAVAAGAKIINISLRLGSYGALKDSADWAREQGALVFLAPGNTNRALGGAQLALNTRNVIVVSGTDQNDNRWQDDLITGSTYGQWIDLSAPAANILAPQPGLPEEYGLFRGTSFSAPIAAAAAALAWAINPALSADEVEAMLFATAVDLGPAGWDQEFGHGRVNFAAVADAAWASVPEPSVVGVLLLAGAWLGRRGRATA